MLIMIFLLTGCQKKEIGTSDTKEQKVVSEEKTTQATQVKEEGNTLYLAMRTVQTLNPLLNADETVDNILKLIYMPLIQLDEKRKPVPCIAKSWHFGEDKRTLFLELNSNIAWQDGTALTADDVIFSLNTIRSAAPESVYKDVMGYIAGYNKTGEYSLSITFQQVFSGNIYALSFPVISSSYYRGESVLNSEKNMAPMGNGYFKFDYFKPTKELKLEKNQNCFWGAPKIEEVLVSISADKGTDFYSFKQGIINVLAADVTDIGKYDSTKNTNLFEYNSNYYDFIGFNFQKSLFQDIHIRQAVAYALPKDAILDSVYLGHGVLADTPINPTSWLHEDKVQKYPYSLVEADKLLQASHWKSKAKGGIRERNTNELAETLKTSILVNEENEARRQIAVRLADELRALGFDVTIDVQPYEAYVQKLENKDFDMFIGGWQLSVVPDYSFMLHSSQINGGRNYSAYSSEEMDGLLAAAYGAVDDTQVQKAYSNLQKNIAKELPYVSIAYRNSALFADERINGNIKPLENDIFYTISQWSLSNSAKK